jgi:geranylgeranyl diphosphate synthase type I
VNPPQTSARATETAPAILARAQKLARPALEAAIAQLTPHLRLPVLYHLGWADADGAPRPDSGGKGVRVALAILSAEAAGAPAETGVPAAVAVELVHNFSLLHDDIIDKDEERRHRATVWSVFGVGQAIVAGDALLSLAHEVVVGAPSLRAFDAARRLAAATSQMIAGQAQDIAAEHRPDTTLDACEEMERAKTGALLGAAASLGAVLADAADSLVNRLEEFGVELGLSFQAIDDILGIWGDPTVTGKPAWSDLRAAKASLPVAAALAGGGPESAELQRLLGDGEVPEALLPRVAELVEEAGGRRYATKAAESHFEAARRALADAPIPPAARQRLLELARFVVDRAY